MVNKSVCHKSLSAKQLYLKIQYSEIQKVVNDIADLFPYAIIKGIPLSIMAHNDCYKRNIGDVDFLINKKNIELLDKILKKNGFVCDYNNREDKLIALLYSHQTRPYFKKTPMYKTYVDVNYDIFWGEYTGKRIDINEMLDDLQEINIEGILVKTLSPIKMLIALILHHYKETNSIYHLYTHNTIRKDMFFDVYRLIKNNLDLIPISSFVDICSKYEISPYAYYILYYTYMLFQDSDIYNYMKSIQSTEGEILLDCYGLNKSERKQWKCDFLTRVEATELKSYIADQLSVSDLEKIKRNRIIFGE